MMRKRTMVLLTLSGAVAATLVAWMVLIHLAIRPAYEERPFSREVWLAHHDDPDPLNPRVEMVHDLMKHHLRKGATRGDVLGLLGPPDRRDEKRVISYLLGMQGFHADPGQLEVEFDNQGRLAKFRVVER
jgi:hypothetical protein